MSSLTMNSDLSADIAHIISYTIGISILRFSVSGIVNTWLKDLPCLFQLFSRDITVAQNRRKLHENLWYSMWHTTSFLWGSYHLSQQGWMRQVFIQNDLDALSTGYPQSASSLGYRTLYLVELGFWLSCCLYLAFETRRKDFVEMGIHHLSTVILISFSYLFDFSRPGLLIMTLHDIGDVFLYSAKSAQYKRYQGLADVLFAVFAISFYVTRLYVLPTYLFYGLARALWQGDASESMRTIKTHGSDRMLTWLVGIFGVLICLHFMWGAIIAKMVLRTLKSSDKKSVAKDGDPRSDSEAELETDVSPNGATGVVGTTKKNK